ncbi:MAG: hypothetical protein N2111_02225 [Candidatus Sumerlaeaceae bacterium]|nr:hypothetical protein [Candidatus Sumerlaeaceae bacterium]
MTLRSAAIAAAAVAAIVLAAKPLRAETTAAAAPYRMEDGRVVLVGWDDAPVTTHVERLRLEPESFSTASIYRRRLLVRRGRLESAPFEMPADATRIRLAASGDPVENEFPRVRLSLVPADGSSTVSETVVFEGFISSLLLQNFYAAVPRGFHGLSCRLAIEMTNPGDLFDGRTLRLAHVAFEREETRSGH